MLYCKCSNSILTSSKAYVSYTDDIIRLSLATSLFEISYLYYYYINNTYSI